jgi:hypothetical protein
MTVAMQTQWQNGDNFKPAVSAKDLQSRLSSAGLCGSETRPRFLMTPALLSLQRKDPAAAHKWFDRACNTGKQKRKPLRAESNPERSAGANTATKLDLAYPR